MHREEYALSSLRKALQLRAKARIGSIDALCVYDLAGYFGIEVRMEDYPSMEGMYCQTSSPLIIVSSLRPAGRQAYTCAHELGHHIFGHGHRVDELAVDRFHQKVYDPLEFQADCFAGALLMPPTAIRHTLYARGWTAGSCTPEQLFVIASSFGVGYTTIINHLWRAMHLLNEEQASRLLRFRVKYLREILLGNPCDNDLYIVDHHWPVRPVDVKIGDYIILPSGAEYEGKCMTTERKEATRTILRAVSQGCGVTMLPSEEDVKKIRVSRQQYHGRCIYRHLEDDDAE
jgi:Zn-dependent peptidase ImmA (M78 family)